jgi:AcrR family transcriptional regulator
MGRIVAMPRWDPRAEDRLREAALELFLEHGYENVTVAEITERAGLTRRTFSRYFTDKRDVLFAGSERLPAALANSVRHADSTLSSFEALLTALVDVGGMLADQAQHAAQRRAVVQASPELQEREGTKFAAVTDAVADALRDRGTAESAATLLAQVGVAIFRTAFERWTDQSDRAGLPARIREAAAELAASLAAVDLAALPVPATPSSSGAG